MNFGTKIKMLRPYDRHQKDAVLVAGDDVALGVAEALCAGEKPYAKALVESRQESEEEGDE